MILLAAMLFVIVPFCFADTTIQAPEDTIRSYMEAWNRHDPEAAAAFIATDGEFLDSSVGVAQVGREAAKNNVIKVFISAVPDLQWKMIGKPIIQGQHIAFEWEFTGTNTGNWSEDIPATERKVSFKGVSFIQLDSSKIKTQHDYYDALSLNKQLGW
jgi:steroid delta-isomerase-like uncharacterized protein